MNGVLYVKGVFEGERVQVFCTVNGRLVFMFFILNKLSRYFTRPRAWESIRFRCNPIRRFVYRMKLCGRACDETVYLSLRRKSAGDDTCTCAINHALNGVYNNTFTE